MCQPGLDCVLMWLCIGEWALVIVAIGFMAWAWGE